MGAWARREIRYGSLVRGLTFGALFAIGVFFFGRSVLLSGAAFAAIFPVAALTGLFAASATVFGERAGLRARLVAPSPENRGFILQRVVALAALLSWFVPALALTIVTSDGLNSFALAACSLLAGGFLGSASWRDAPPPAVEPAVR